MEKDNLTKNTMLLVIGTLLTNLLQFIMIPLFSSWLSPADYGKFDLCITYVSLMLPLLNLASGEAVFRFSIESNEQERKAHITNGFVITIGNTVIIAAILLCVGVVFQKSILISFDFLLVAQSLNSYCQSYLRGIKKLKLYSLGMIVTTAVISISVTYFLLFAEMGLHGIIWGYALGYMIGDFFILIISKYWMYFSVNTISVKGMASLIQYSYPLIPNNICWWVINASDRLLIRYFIGPIGNGLYAIAHKVPNVCASLAGMFNISWQESAAENVHSINRNEYYNSIYNNSIVIITSLCSCVLSFNFFLFDYVFNSQYSEARLYMPILVIAIIFSTISQFYGGIMISLKMPKANGVTTLVSAVVNLLVHVTLVKFIGLYAAAISTLCSNICLCFFRFLYLKKNVCCSIKKKTFTCICLCMCMFIAAYIEMSLIGRLINVCIAAGAFLYINRKALLQILEKIRRQHSN